MPHTLSYGTESAANKAIGGVPTIHYFDFQSRGRGQVVRLMLIDSGAAYEDVRYTFDEWPEQKRSGPVAEMNPTGNIPVLEMPNGKILTQSYAILRHWSRQLGAYDGKTEDEKYWADAICDIVVDWRTLFIAAFFSDNQKEDYPKHQQGDRNRYINAIETHLKGSDLSRRGPYIIGKEVTYADLVLFQVLHDENMIQGERADLKQYPRLIQLVDAVLARPNIKKFFDSSAYLG
ncbi:Glutathione S-transferase P [Lachnellula suecica]|uniref:Glutathione S-transferase P n=1 Tax=Lachnellula suecica TaxID=602035 RepID=A0A8T9CF10_9HELO|nr:Glutathione S-transferase P [Lachnellula suecica]